MKTLLRGAARTVFAAMCVLALPVQAHQAKTLDELVEAFGWDFEKTPVLPQQIADKLYVVFGVGGNILVSAGDEGVLIVDDQFPQLMPRIKKAIAGFGHGEHVDFAINTHWHFDHAEGNLALGKDGTLIVSQLNSRQMMLTDRNINLVSLQYLQERYPEHALPVITYEKSMQIFFNGERIDLLHSGPAHTTGDTAIIFRSSNVVHMGDVFNNAGYPFIDADNGGHINGMIEFCQMVADELDKTSLVVPGHGPVAKHADLLNYIEMLTTVRNRVQALINEGATLEQIIESEPTSEFDRQYGSDSAGFIDRTFHSLLMHK